MLHRPVEATPKKGSDPFLGLLWQKGVRPLFGVVVALLALHCLEELRVGLGVLQLVQQELDRGEFVHRMQYFS